MCRLPLAPLLSLACCMLAHGQEAPALPVHLFEVPRGADGKPMPHPLSSLQERAERVFRSAELKVRFEVVPLRRSLEQLRHNSSAFCLLGAFRTPEREQFARFSRAVGQEEQQLLIAPAKVATRLRELPSAQAALSDTRFQLLVFEGVSYGQELDRWIAQRPAALVRAGASTARVLPMLERGHADLFIGARSELDALRLREGYPADHFEAVLLPGMPSPPTRHLACSFRVDAAWLARFDAALSALP